MDHLFLPQPCLLGVHAVPFPTNQLQLGAAAGGLVLGEELVVYVQAIVIAHRGRHLQLEALHGG